MKILRYFAQSIKLIHPQISQHRFANIRRKLVTMESKPKVVFVLGAPGAGKGTQCEKIVAEYGFTHLSAGDLLREERNRKGSEFGALIEDYITNGKIVPVEITCSLLENAMNKTNEVTFVFVIVAQLLEFVYF